jgi:hypothetical protein
MFRVPDRLLIRDNYDRNGHFRKRGVGRARNRGLERLQRQERGRSKELISIDVVAVYPDGIYNFQQRLDGMSKMTLKSFSLGNFNVSMVSNDVAIVSYRAKVQNQDGSSAELNRGTVWNLRNGEWKAVFHADMAAAPAK